MIIYAMGYFISCSSKYDNIIIFKGFDWHYATYRKCILNDDVITNTWYIEVVLI